MSTIFFFFLLSIFINIFFEVFMNDKNLEKKIKYAQNNWANFILKISNAFNKRDDYISIANDLLDKLYSFNHDKIMFKPTMPGIKTFRYSREDVLSYFIGGNNALPFDQGFAIKPWKKITFSNSSITQRDNIIFTMGLYTFQDLNNTILEVEYTFIYELDDDNQLKIILHHSSVPYK